MRTTTFLLLSLLLSVPILGATRTVEATFVARLSAIPAGAAKIKVWVPIPRSTESQSIRNLQVESPFRWTRSEEPEFGNVYLFAEIEDPEEGMELLKLHFLASRDEVLLAQIKPVPATRQELRRNLRADRLVTLSPRIRRLAAEVTRGKTDRLSQAKAIYDHVLTTMKYDKTASGWGKGDTERACDIRKGNCTDFHSLFISLARARGIPARFIMGFPMSRGDGETTGYHCWAEFYVAGKGWIPVDPSEASKSSDPVRREYLFGNLDPDRVQFTMGRDIRLTPATNQPLNFFIYPHAEWNGEVVGSPGISFAFRDVRSPAAVAAGAEAGIDVAPVRLEEVSKPGTHQP